MFDLFKKYKRSRLLKNLLNFERKPYSLKVKLPGLLDDSFFLFKKASES